MTVSNEWAEFRERAKRGGFWQEAFQMRDRLRAEGKSASDAKREVMRLFPEGCVVNPPVIGPAHPCFVEDGDLCRPPEQVPPPVSEDEPTPGPIQEGVDCEDGIIAQLTVAGRGRTARQSDAFAWVYANQAMPLEQIDPATVPDSGAVGWLVWARTVGMNEFFKQWTARAAKLLEIEESQRRTDDGSVIDQLIAALLPVKTVESDEPALNVVPSEQEAMVEPCQ